VVFYVEFRVHATITGVLLAFAIPQNGDKKINFVYFTTLLHKPVAFVILPIFALANTAIVFGELLFKHCPRVIV
jgi:NhaA family Na+:H+ antiporter